MMEDDKCGRETHEPEKEMKLVLVVCVQFWIEWLGKASLRKWYLSKDLKEIKDQAEVSHMVIWKKDIPSRGASHCKDSKVEASSSVPGEQQSDTLI